MAIIFHTSPKRILASNMRRIGAQPLISTERTLLRSANFIFAMRRIGSRNITWTGYGYNLGLATLGNIVGGALFVAGAYWIGSPKAREQARKVVEAESTNGVLADKSLVPAGEAR